MNLVTLIPLGIALIFFLIGLPMLYSIKKEISNIKQRKTYYFVIGNIIATLLFTLINIVLIIFVILDQKDLVINLAAVASLLTGLFVLIVCVVTKEIGKLIFIVNNLRNLDSFTNVYNRKFIEKSILNEFLRCVRYKRSSALMMLDIDKFKQINDTYGHQAGDKVILDLVDILKENLRNTDLIGRYGGDEFMVVMTETCADNAAVFKERLLDIFSKSIVVHDGAEIGYSVSIGILEVDLTFKDYAEWINKVDHYLYQSKRAEFD